ncbi:hypothetical protein C0J45_7461 [Silurus meridionalis]|nr:hypothetical protein C0J45_7461 [Silurus meridionalis]
MRSASGKRHGSRVSKCVRMRTIECSSGRVSVLSVAAGVSLTASAAASAHHVAARSSCLRVFSAPVPVSAQITEHITAVLIASKFHHAVHDEIVDFVKHLVGIAPLVT